jgi:transposase
VGAWFVSCNGGPFLPCTVIAPSLIPSKAGDQVKTDKKDAIKLARLDRAGELTAVHIPVETDEAKRVHMATRSRKGYWRMSQN